MGKLLAFRSATAEERIAPLTTDGEGTPTSSPDAAHESVKAVGVTFPERPPTSPHVELSVRQTHVSFEKLYPLEELLSPSVAAARRLLADAAQIVKDACDAERNGDLVLSDDLLRNRLHAVLLEAFCMRSIGDGFATLVSALLGAIENDADRHLTLRHSTSILRRIQTLGDHPFVTVEQADGEVTALEDAGLNIEPPAFHQLTELLADS